MSKRSHFLVVQWEDSAPDMDYDDWLIAEIGIQCELLDDLDSDDVDGIDSLFDYIGDIVQEIRNLKENP